ncbi:hypothetical protein BGY98DRAFT_1009315 [Russula aff. rugulosa BPL654]|nr:hypothetical protein BGY98DRAFT_1009315 [Russula aff. rugulosa BPL654]
MYASRDVIATFAGAPGSSADDRRDWIYGVRNDRLTARVVGQGTSRVFVHRMRRKSATGAANKHWECS